MTLADGQYRYDNPNGVSLIIGAGTPYRVIDVTGLRAPGAISASDTKRTGQQGTLRAGRRTYGLRVMQFDLVVDTSTNHTEDVEMLIDDFYSCFQSTDDEGSLVFKRRAKEERVIFCTPRLADFPGNYDSWVGSAVGSVQLAASDPRVYSSLLETWSFVGPTSGGRPYPRVYPIVYTGGVSSVTTITNRGNSESPPIIQFIGPLTNPGLLHLESGKIIKMNYDIPAGSIVEVDTDLHTITLNGVPRRGMLDPVSDWWTLQPGINTVTLISTGAGSSVLKYQSAWVSG